MQFTAGTARSSSGITIRRFCRKRARNFCRRRTASCTTGSSPTASCSRTAKRKRAVGFETADQLRLSIVKYLPHARQKITFSPGQRDGQRRGRSESAVLVKVQAGGETNEVWLKRADPEYGYPADQPPRKARWHRLRLRAAAAGVLAETRPVSARNEPGHDGRRLVCQLGPRDRQGPERRSARRNRHESTAGLRRVHVLPVQLR